MAVYTTVHWRRYAWVLLALLATMHLVHGQLRLADPDEYQVLVNAVDAARGLTPYVDYWDNHGPLNIWLLKPLISLWSGGHNFIFWMRGLMWVQTLVLAAGIFWLTKRTMPNFPAAPWIALIFLLAAPPFVAKSIELRGDNPANLLTTIALGCLAAALTTGRRSLFLITGLAIGVIAGFTLKFIVIGAALAGFCAAWCWREKKFPGKRDTGYVAAGVLIPIGIMLLLLSMNSSLESFLACYFGGNVKRDSAGISSSKIVDMYKQAPFWSGWATIVTGYWAWQVIRRRAEGLETGLLTMVLIVLGQFILILPTKNLQSLLTLYTPLAILGGGATARWINFCRNKNSRMYRWLYAVALAGPVLLARDLIDYSNLKNQELPKEVQFADTVRQRTAYGKFIFDPSGVVFLKPRPGNFHVLVTFIRKMHQAGIIDLQIPKMLAAHDVRNIIFNDRSKDLRTSDVKFMIANYSPVLMGRNCWLLSSKASGDNLLPKQQSEKWQAWVSNVYDDAATPTQPSDPPEWYKVFMAASN